MSRCEKGCAWSPCPKCGYTQTVRGEWVAPDDERILMPNALPGGDPHWVQAYQELFPLHLDKSSTYGTNGDKLANFTESAVILGKPAEYPVLVRVLDKVSRSIHMIDNGRANEVREYPDLASLCLVAEALLRRRLGIGD